MIGATGSGGSAGVNTGLLSAPAIRVDRGAIGPVVKFVAIGKAGSDDSPRTGAGAKPVTGLPENPETGLGANPVIVGVPRVVVVWAGAVEIANVRTPTTAKYLIHFRFITKTSHKNFGLIEPVVNVGEFSIFN